VNDPDDLLESLPVHDVSAAAAARIQRHVHALAARRRAALAAPRIAALARCYHRFVEPAALVGLGLSQLLWALRGTLSLLQP
jgi:hypothetical protein